MEASTTSATLLIMLNAMVVFVFINYIDGAKIFIVGASLAA